MINDFSAVVEISAPKMPMSRLFSIPMQLEDIHDKQRRHLMIVLMSIVEMNGGTLRINKDAFVKLQEDCKIMSYDDPDTGDLLLKILK